MKSTLKFNTYQSSGKHEYVLDLTVEVQVRDTPREYVKLAYNGFSEVIKVKWRGGSGGVYTFDQTQGIDLPTDCKDLAIEVSTYAGATCRQVFDVAVIRVALPAPFCRVI